MAWAYLLLAAVCEVAWAIGMKYSRGFTRLGPSVFTIVGMILSVVFLAKAVRTLPIGTAYAVWTGLGAAGTAVLGTVLLGEERSLSRLLCLALILGGVVGLKLTAHEHDETPASAAAKSQSAPTLRSRVS